MANISLRVYNREIEGLIEGGQLDEAIAHCQHILKTFSMHIETYQLLGKAFLEFHHYTDAADIFQRILNAVPDDFIAHVGMSIIRDDEAKLDEAIWHMERAYEVQPSNPAIQGELRRLYGRRDGVEPTKIRLSRDALANMYAQGELFNQAIAEIRAVLADDPDRPDLQVMLARAYFRVGQKVEAAEISAHLLKKFPYCLDALRILVEVLPGSARAENTQVYRQRLRLLDPYSSFVTGSVFNSGQVADASVNLERLDYLAGKQISAGQPPTWAASLGIKLDEEKKDAPPPTWLDDNQIESPSEQQPDQPKPEPDQGSEVLPDFLRAAGWSESDGEQTEGAISGEEPKTEEISKAEMPDWLKSQIPAELSSAKPSEGGEIDEGADLPVWLTDTNSPATSKTGKEGEEQSSINFQEEQDSLGGKIKDLGLSKAGFMDAMPAEPESPLTSTPDTQRPQPVANKDDGMSWLESLAGEQGMKEDESHNKSEEQNADFPDWMKPTVENQATADSPSPIQELSTEGADGAISSEVPDEEIQEEAFPPEYSGMQKDLEEINTGVIESQPTNDGGVVKPLGIEDDTMAWLEGLAAKQGAKAEELLTKPEERSDELPDWIKTTAQELPPDASQESIPSSQSRDLTEPSVSEGIMESPLAMPDWLDESAQESERKSTDLLKLEPESHSVPEAIPAEEPSETQETARQTTDAMPGSEFGEPPQVSSEEDVTITTWLKNLDDSNLPSKTAPPPPVAEPSTPTEEIPDWLKDLEKPAIHTESMAGEEFSESTKDLPEWLQQSSEPLPEQPEPQIQEEEKDIHEWAPEEVEPINKPTPTEPAEWMLVGKSDLVPAKEEIQSDLKETQAPVPTPVPPLMPKGTGTLSSIPTQDKDATTLESAQQLLDTHHLEEAMKEYSKLIKKGRLLDEVIHDLREALYRFPVDIILWQSLGDAYMRANRLQDALDAYTKAEELLR